MKKSTKFLKALCLSAILMTLVLPAAQAKEAKINSKVVNQESRLDFHEYNISNEQWLELEKKYKPITKERNLIIAMDLMKDTVGRFSYEAILGANLTNKPIKIEFKDLTEINPNFANFDAAGSKIGSKLYININQKHKDAPPMALAALLSHEALHQDAYNSINEETYAWTMEAAVWTQLAKENPDNIDAMYPLVQREEMLKKMFIKGGYTDRYIRKNIIANPAYSNLQSRSPGFEDNNL